MKHTNKESKKFKSPLTGKYFDPAEALEKIRVEMQALQYDHTGPGKDDLSTSISKALASHGMILDGLHYLWINTELRDYLDEDRLMAIGNSFFELKQLVEIREKQHGYTWDIAFHGESKL